MNIKRQQFRRGVNRLVECRSCGKQTHSNLDGCEGLDLCRPCREEAEMENEHNDGYHIDDGEGADFYNVGSTLGGGGVGIWKDGKLLPWREAEEFGNLRRAMEGFARRSGFAPTDVVLFTVKLYDAERAAAQLGPLIGPDTMVVTLQNGVDAVDIVARHVGREHTAGTTRARHAEHDPIRNRQPDRSDNPTQFRLDHLQLTRSKNRSLGTSDTVEAGRKARATTATDPRASLAVACGIAWHSVISAC
jgi:hypothetical protein